MMSKKFGARYSPSTAPSAGRKESMPPRHPLRWRTTAITIAASPLLAGAFFGDAAHMAINFAGFGIIASAMFMTREGLQAEAAYNARRIARKPSLPRKSFGTALTGLGLGVAAYEPSASPVLPALVGAIGACLHYLSFGLDPMRDKGMEGVDTVQQDRVARVIHESEAYLVAMNEAVSRLRDRRLEARVALFSETARELFRRVQNDPASLTAARRYLGVYLMGARDATIKFVDHYSELPDPAIRAEYEALLADLETNFAARSRDILEGGRDDLDIEVQVLRERLAREGIRTDPDPAPAQTDADPAELPSPADVRIKFTREQRLDDLLKEARLHEQARLPR